MIPAFPVAITGMGCICAAGSTLKEASVSIFGNRRKPAPPKRFSADHPYAYPVFEIPLDFLDKNETISLTSRMGIAASVEALTNAEWTPEDLSRLRVGVCMGTTVGCTMNDENFYRKFKAGQLPDIQPIKRFLVSNPASAIARHLSLCGPAQTVVNACCSGTDAIGIGTSWIRNGLCDVVIAGGSDELCRVTYNGFISLMITDPYPCRPFDKNRKGLNLGEGAGIVIMESESIRKKRTKKADAFVLGYGTAGDAFHLTAPKPDGIGLKRAISQALMLSDLDTSRVGFIAAHGTGTIDNDKVESLVLNEIFPQTPFFSTKGHTGHTLGAAGAIQAIFAVLCLQKQMIPMNAGLETPDPDLPANPTLFTRKFLSEIAISESLAFGGNNSVLVLQKGAEDK
jgi:3-oxoacyl-[acyl-carrier-protein] synthase-1/3-oxoacyl-[acyl-carrier-protein] synthase II